VSGESWNRPRSDSICALHKTFQDTGPARQSYLVKAVFKFRNYIVIKCSTGVVSSKSPGSE